MSKDKQSLVVKSKEERSDKINEAYDEDFEELVETLKESIDQAI